MLSYKYYLNTVTRTVSKHTATVMSCYHINITLTQTYVPLPPAAIQPVFSHCAVTPHTKVASWLVILQPKLHYGLGIDIKKIHLLFHSGPGSVVVIATGYLLDGQGIEFRWGWSFPHLSKTGLGAHPASCTMGTGSFRGQRATGPWRLHLTPSSAVDKKE